MRLSIHCIAFITLGLLIIPAAFAETSFIRDQINVTVHSMNPSGGTSIDDKLTTIPSGEAVEVLERDGSYAKIRHKNTEGWVEADMLTREKPQKIRYVQLLAKFKAVSQDLKDTQAKLGNQQETKKEAMTLAKLNQELTQARSKIKELETTINTPAAAKTESDEPKQADKPAAGSPAMTPIPAVIAGVGMVICLILGMYLGYSYLDKQIRNRHGGVRIR